jgi:hypothetical protein
MRVALVLRYVASLHPVCPASVCWCSVCVFGALGFGRFLPGLVGYRAARCAGRRSTERRPPYGALVFCSHGSLAYLPPGIAWGGIGGRWVRVGPAIAWPESPSPSTNSLLLRGGLHLLCSPCAAFASYSCLSCFGHMHVMPCIQPLPTLHYV